MQETIASRLAEKVQTCYFPLTLAHSFKIFKQVAAAWLKASCAALGRLLAAWQNESFPPIWTSRSY